MTDTFVFSRDWLGSTKWMNDEEELAYYRSIIAYGLNGIEPDVETTPSNVGSAFEACKVRMDYNADKREQSIENGRKGGAPLGNRNASKKQPKTTENNRKQPKTTENNLNEHVYEHVYEHVNNIYCPAGQDDTSENDAESAKEIIRYLNARAEKHFDDETAASLDVINDRLNEGYTVEVLKQIIDVKVEEWKGTEYDKYLRPKTLFSEKNIESYREQKNIKPKPKNQFMQFEQHDHDISELERKAKMRGKAG